MKNEKTPTPKPAKPAEPRLEREYVEITKRIPLKDADRMTQAELEELDAKYSPDLISDSVKRLCEKNSDLVKKVVNSPTVRAIRAIKELYGNEVPEELRKVPVSELSREIKEKLKTGLDIEGYADLQTQKIVGVTRQNAEKNAARLKKAEAASCATLKEALASWADFAVDVDPKIALAVQMYMKERSYKKVANHFGVSKTTLTRWFREFEKTTNFPLQIPKPGENFSVKRQLSDEHKRRTAEDTETFYDNMDV